MVQNNVSSSSSSTRIGCSRVPMGSAWGWVGRCAGCGWEGVSGRREMSGKTMATAGVGRQWRTDGLGDAVRLYGGKGSSLSGEGDRK